jgi:hypothetical protein
MPTATEMRDKYLVAEQALLEGKEVAFGDRKLRLEDLGEIRKGRQEWEARVKSETDGAAGKPRIGGIAFKVANLSGE